MSNDTEYVVQEFAGQLRAFLARSMEYAIDEKITPYTLNTLSTTCERIINQVMGKPTHNIKVEAKANLDTGVGTASAFVAQS